MFLRFYKRFVLKKIVKKNFSDNERQISEIKIKSVAILVDGNRFRAISELLNLMQNEGLSQVRAFVFTKDKKVENTDNIIYFSSNDIEANGQIKNSDLLQQITHPYDLIINYYDEKNIDLLYLTSVTKAGFRVGFKQNHIEINELMIDVNINDHQVFIEELFKYLKKFNKI